MDQSLIGKWVEVTLVNGKTWVGCIEEWDEEALFISNGIAFGAPNHKGAECTNEEVEEVSETDQREFAVS